MRRHVSARILMTAGACLAAVIPAHVALAACHYFAISPQERPANEGHGPVNLIVTRFGEGAPSSVRVRTSNGTAVAGQDYQPFDQRVRFEDGTRQTIEIVIINDEAVEGEERFKVTLSEGSGCNGTPSDHGPPATVIIQDDDPSPPPPQFQGPGSAWEKLHPSPPPPSPRVSPSPSPSPPPTVEVSPTPSEVPDVVESSEPTQTVAAAADNEEKGPSSMVPIVVAIALVVAGGAGAGIWWLRRRAA